MTKTMKKRLSFVIMFAAVLVVAIICSLGIKVNSADTMPPTGSITATNNVAASQTAQLIFSDDAGVAGYYWGTSPSYSNNQYTPTSAATAMVPVNTNGTYYLTVRDVSGKLSETKSITFYYTYLNICYKNFYEINYGIITLPDGTAPECPKILTESGKSFTLPHVSNTKGLIFSHWIDMRDPTTAFADCAQIKVTGDRYLETVWTDPAAPDCSLYGGPPGVTMSLQLSYSDNIGVSGYYFGTSPIYSENPYKSTSSSTGNDFEEVDTEGTYYLTVKDWYDNVSETKALTVYKLTLDTTGGFWYPPYVLMKSGAEYQLPEPTKVNCYFSHWNTAPDGSGTSYAAGTYFSISDNVTLYARWNQAPDPTCSIISTNAYSPSQTLTFTFSDYSVIAGYYWGTSPSYLQNQFTSTYETTVKKTIQDDGTYYLTVKDTSGHVSETKSITFYKTTLDTNGGYLSFGYILTEKGKVLKLPVPVKTNYILYQWNTAPDGSGTPYSCQEQYTAEKNQTLYAQWFLCYYTVIYDFSFNGGNGATHTAMAVAAGSTVDLTPEAYKTGWDFVGWNTDPNAVTGLTELTMGTRDIRLYAIFKRIPAVTYDYAFNGGSSAPILHKTVHAGDPVDLTPQAYKYGWDFIGWNTDPEAHSGLSSLSMPAGDVTLYAIYRNHPSVRFVYYHDLSDSPVQRETYYTIYNNELAPVSVPEFDDPDGWDIFGWTTSTEPDASPLTDFSVSEDTTFYCMYKRELTLTYDANGGSTTPPAQTGIQYCNSRYISYKKNPGIILADAVSKDGCTFVAWAKGGVTGTRSDAGTMISISQDTTVYAVWRDSGANVYNMGEETYSFENYADSHSKGHCFGMAMTSSGYYTENLDPAVIGLDSPQHLHTLSPTETVKAPICHYQLIQGSYAEAAIVAGTKYGIDGFYTIRPVSDWKDVVNYVKNHACDDKGSLEITIRSLSGAHAVSFLRYREVDGQSRIYVYDNNFPDTETYLYLGDDDFVHQSPRATLGNPIVGISISDVSKYFLAAGSYDPTHVIYADNGVIEVEGAEASVMCGDYGDVARIMYEIPADMTTVTITPLTDNADFTYMDTTYSFNCASDGETIGTLTLAETENGAVTIEPALTEGKRPHRVNSVSLNDLTVRFKSTKTLDPRIAADGDITYTVKYSSSDPDVATVDKNGTVYGNKPGKAEIKVTVTDQYGNKVTDTCTVTVRQSLLQWIIKILKYMLRI